MSCDSWIELSAHGDLVLREGSKERAEAERHFGNCPTCAQRAFLLDPSWAVSRTWGSEGPALSAISAASDFGAEEVADVKRAVLESTRIRDVEDAVDSRSTGARAAIAAAVLIALIAGGILLRTVGLGPGGSHPGLDTSVVGVSAESLPDDFLPRPFPALDVSLPTVGSLAPAAARVYDFGQKISRS